MASKPVLQIPGFERLTKCPKEKGCRAKLLFRDNDGKLWSFLENQKAFSEHVCHVPKNNKPAVMYMAEWHNTRTGTTRYIVRPLKRSALIPPVSITQPRPEWELKGLYSAKLDWKPEEE